jgi:hypothetical protein
VAAGPAGEVLTGPVLSEAYGMPLLVERHDGRAWARLDGQGAHAARDAARIADTPSSHRTGTMPS